jgi:hypothetical protein
MSLFVKKNLYVGKRVFLTTKNTKSTKVIYCCAIDYGDFNHVIGYAAMRSEEQHENNPCWDPWCLIFKEQ